MHRRSNKNTKRELRQEIHLTRPPRLEGKAKNAAMELVKKEKKTKPVKRGSQKSQGYGDAQRRDYQLKSKRRRVS